MGKDFWSSYRGLFGGGWRCQDRPERSNLPSFKADSVRHPTIVRERMVGRIGALDLYEKELEHVSAMPGVVLCPMVPVRSMVQRQSMIILKLNTFICRLTQVLEITKGICII